MKAKSPQELEYIKVKFSYDFQKDAWYCAIRIAAISVMKNPMVQVWGLKDESHEPLKFSTIHYPKGGWNICVTSEHLYQNGPGVFTDSIASLDEEIHEYFTNNEIRDAVTAAIKNELYAKNSLMTQTLTFAPGKYYLSKVEQDKILAGEIPIEHGSQLKRIMPGLNAMVKHPVTGLTDSVEGCIISLNDHYEWPREKVADWLDTLDVDLSFPMEEENE